MVVYDNFIDSILKSTIAHNDDNNTAVHFTDTPSNWVNFFHSGGLFGLVV